MGRVPTSVSARTFHRTAREGEAIIGGRLAWTSSSLEHLGILGGAVAEKLQAAGHRVAGLARSDAAVGRLRERGMTPVRAELFDTARLAQAAKTADGVMHLAASFGPDWQAGDRAAVQALLGALDGSGKPFVYTSIAPVYGDAGASVADEDAPLNPPRFHRWRPAVEQEVLAAAARGVRTIVLRPAPVYGRSGGSSVLLLVQNAQQAGAARYIGAGETRWSTVHVDELADLYVLALERAAGGTLLNASSGISVSMRELAAAVAVLWAWEAPVSPGRSTPPARLSARGPTCSP